jgi:heme exporter protein D
MDSVLGYGRTFFIGGEYRAPVMPDFMGAVAHFHKTLADVARHLEREAELREAQRTPD